MTRTDTHYTNFGVNFQSRVADAAGFIAYRTDFQTLAVDTWTVAERWIDAQERRINAWRGNVSVSQAK
jgi:hypothetical protein